MTHINLLPWRKLMLERKKKQFWFYLLVAAISACVTVFLMHYYIAKRVYHQRIHHVQLEHGILQCNQKIKQQVKMDRLRKKLLFQMTVVKDLQSKREAMNFFLKSLIEIMPIGVVLTQIERQVDNIILVGHSESTGQISRLMRNISHATWIHSSDLPEIKKLGVDNEFKVTFMLRSNQL